MILLHMFETQDTHIISFLRQMNELTDMWMTGRFLLTWRCLLNRKASYLIALKPRLVASLHS